MLAVAFTLPPLILPVVEIIPDPADKLPPVMLPVAEIVVVAVNEPVDVIPVVVRLPPLTLPVAITVVPAIGSGFLITVVSDSNSNCAKLK
jgi:hypothetical protein